MRLEFESGKVIHNARASDIRKNLKGEEFTILLSDEHELTFMQCAEDYDEPGQYILEYQDGSTYEHYCAVETIPLERVLAAFYKYLRNDKSWRSDFIWNHTPM
jgi:hypothetical protein